MINLWKHSRWDSILEQHHFTLLQLAANTITQYNIWSHAPLLYVNPAKVATRAYGHTQTQKNEVKVVHIRKLCDKWQCFTLLSVFIKMLILIAFIPRGATFTCFRTQIVPSTHFFFSGTKTIHRKTEKHSRIMGTEYQPGKTKPDTQHDTLGQWRSALTSCYNRQTTFGF